MSLEEAAKAAADLLDAVAKGSPPSPYICWHKAPQVAAALRAALAEARSPVALESVELQRDTSGMCTVLVNGRVAIRDNGDVISNHATLDWFSGTADKLLSEECGDGDALLRMLGLDPEQYRTEGGRLNLPRIRAALAEAAKAEAEKAEPVAWRIPGKDSIVTARDKQYYGYALGLWSEPLYLHPPRREADTYIQAIAEAKADMETWPQWMKDAARIGVAKAPPRRESAEFPDYVLFALLPERLRDYAETGPIQRAVLLDYARAVLRAAGGAE